MNLFWNPFGNVVKKVLAPQEPNNDARRAFERQASLQRAQAVLEEDDYGISPEECAAYFERCMQAVTQRRAARVAAGQEVVTREVAVATQEVAVATQEVVVATPQVAEATCLEELQATEAQRLATVAERYVLRTAGVEPRCFTNKHRAIAAATKSLHHAEVFDTQDQKRVYVWVPLSERAKSAHPKTRGAAKHSAPKPLKKGLECTMAELPLAPPEPVKGFEWKELARTVARRYPPIEVVAYPFPRQQVWEAEREKYRKRLEARRSPNLQQAHEAFAALGLARRADGRKEASGGDWQWSGSRLVSK